MVKDKPKKFQVQVTTVKTYEIEADTADIAKAIATNNYTPLPTKTKRTSVTVTRIQALLILMLSLCSCGTMVTVQGVPIVRKVRQPDEITIGDVLLMNAGVVGGITLTKHFIPIKK